MSGNAALPPAGTPAFTRHWLRNGDEQRIWAWAHGRWWRGEIGGYDSKEPIIASLEGWVWMQALEEICQPVAPEVERVARLLARQANPGWDPDTPVYAGEPARVVLPQERRGFCPEPRPAKALWRHFIPAAHEVVEAVQAPDKRGQRQ